MQLLKEIFAIVNHIKRLLHSLEKKNTLLCFFFPATSFIILSHSKQFFGMVSFDAISSTFLIFVFNSIASKVKAEFDS